MVPKDQAQHWAGVTTCSLEAAWGPCCAPPSSPSSAHDWSDGLKMMSPPLGPGTTASLGHPCPVGQSPKAKVVLLAQQDPLEWGRSSGSCQVSTIPSLLHCPLPTWQGFYPSPEGNSVGTGEAERTGREPHPQSLSPGQPWPCQQLKWDKCGVGQKNQEQFICTGSEKASTDETEVTSFLASSDARSNPEHLSV